MKDWFSRIIILQILLIISFSGSVFAKGSDSLYYARLAKRMAFQDTNYIKHYRDKLTLRLIVDGDINKLKLHYKESDKTETYRPNNGVSIGGGFYYKWIGLNLAVLVPSVNRNESKYGTSSGFHIQSNLFLKKWVGTVFIERYKGYYLDNSNTIYPANMFHNQDNVTLRGDIRQVSLNAEVNRVLNYKKYSTRASIQQNEKQKKSAGTILLGGYALLGAIAGDTGLVSKQIAREYHIKKNYNTITYINLGVSGGYAHTFVWGKHFYATASAELGIGVLHEKLYNTRGRRNPNTEETSSNSLNFKFKTYFSLGYNGNRNFIGLNYLNNNYNFISKSDLDIALSIGIIRLYVGRRF